MTRDFSLKMKRKIEGRTAQHKNVRYHNDSVLFPDSVKTCPVCERPFENRKKWTSRGQFAAVVYCSHRCRKLAKKLA